MYNLFFINANVFVRKERTKEDTQLSYLSIMKQLKKKRSNTSDTRAK